MALIKACNKCGKIKDLSAYSKCSAAKDGLQPRCKQCNKEDNGNFRELRPSYGLEWFHQHKDRWKEYMNDYQGSDEINKIYTITNPIGEVYVGISRRKKISYRFKEHRQHYKHKKSTQKMPLLWDSFDKHGIENHTFELITDFKGDKELGLKVEGEMIQHYKGLNRSLNKFK
jgi:hypothetical protein